MSQGEHGGAKRVPRGGGVSQRGKPSWAIRMEPEEEMPIEHFPGGFKWDNGKKKYKGELSEGGTAVYQKGQC